MHGQNHIKFESSTLLKRTAFNHSTYQATNALSKIQLMTSIKLLHVLAPECHL